MMERYGEVQSILADYSGLDTQSIGRQMLERAVKSRLNLVPGRSYVEYLRHLRSDRDEIGCLLELLLVPETWFFRDSGAFGFLAAFVKSEWCNGANRGLLSILSAPCSTGEEPYSIVMTLLQTGLGPAQFRVHACDISPRAVSAAQKGLYGGVSFRAPLTLPQKRFFNTEGNRHRICEAVREVVSFTQGNLADSDFMAGTKAAYDVIFCKNLMIYLGEPGRAKVLANLGRLLRDHGLLLVGHSEVALFQKAGYSPVSSARAFGLTKMVKPLEMPGKRPRHRAAPVRTEVHPPRGAKAHPDKKTGFSAPASHPGTAAKDESPERLLEKARCLADRGDLQEAARVCRSLISADSMDVSAYYLAGLIEQSQDRLAPAEDLFLKAIYLDPHHYETLVQLCLLSERRGDSAKAGQYRKRMRRLEAASKRT